MTSFFGKPQDRTNDPLLGPYLAAKSDWAAKKELQRLFVDHLNPVICKVIYQKFHVIVGKPRTTGNESSNDQLADDAFSEACAEISKKIQNCRNHGEPIGRLTAFSATVTRNECNHVLRDTAPARAQVKRMVVDALKAAPDLKVWKDGRGRSIAGREDWQLCSDWDASRMSDVLDDPEKTVRTAAPGIDFAESRPTQTIRAVFDAAGQPIPINSLVSIVSKLWGINDLEVESLTPPDDENGFVRPEPPAPDDPQKEIEAKEFIMWFWSEVRQLPKLQAAAIMLNNRAIDVTRFPPEGIASVSDMAVAVGLTVIVLTLIWKDLPIDDINVALLLKTTSALIIRNRYVGYKKLARRRIALENRERVLFE